MECSVELVKIFEHISVCAVWVGVVVGLVVLCFKLLLLSVGLLACKIWLYVMWFRFVLRLFISLVIVFSGDVSLFCSVALLSFSTCFCLILFDAILSLMY